MTSKWLSNLVLNKTIDESVFESFSLFYNVLSDKEIISIDFIILKKIEF